MNRTLYALGVLLVAAAAHASDVATVYDEADSRFFIDDNATTSLAVSFTSLAYGLLALLALGLLAAVLTFFLFGSGAEETGYSTGSSYSSYGSARAAAYVYRRTGLVVAGTWTGRGGAAPGRRAMHAYRFDNMATLTEVRRSPRPTFT